MDIDAGCQHSEYFLGDLKPSKIILSPKHWSYNVKVSRYRDFFRWDGFRVLDIIVECGDFGNVVFSF